jgi:acylphosphatase
LKVNRNPGALGVLRFTIYDSLAIHYFMVMEQMARHIIFTGHVQGVGFRYTAHGIARQYRITGFVRNLPDGAVEMLVQGTPSDIEGYLQDVQAEFAGRIRDTQITDAPYNTRYKGFDIAF